MKTSLLFLQTKITKGHWLEAVERYKRIATYVATFSVFGEERPPVMDTKSLADMSAGLREKHEKQSPDRTGPKGCPSRKLSSSFSSIEDLVGGQAGGQHPLRHLPESDIVAKRDNAKNGR